MGWWRVLLESWWWVLCGVALGAAGARVVCRRPSLPLDTHPVFLQIREEARASQARVALLEEAMVDLERDRREILLERDALARQVHELDAELRQARRRAAREAAEPTG